MKSEIVAQLGQSALLLPSLIAEGLAANDRVKLRLSILQMAARRLRDGDNVKFFSERSPEFPATGRSGGWRTGELADQARRHRGGGRRCRSVYRFNGIR